MIALLLVDAQYDFMPGGALAVPGGDAVVPTLNRLQKDYELVCATQDWHPPGHLSFASQHAGKHPFEVIDLDGLEQILWPDHCVWGSRGAAFHEDLNLDRAVAFFRKGVDRRIDSYSAFFDNWRLRSTGLDAWLRDKGADEVHIGGLAAEFCVTYSATDAIECGFATTVLEDATRPLEPDRWAKEADELKRKGVVIRPS